MIHVAEVREQQMIPKVVSCHTRFIIDKIHPLEKKGNVREVKILLFTSDQLSLGSKHKKISKTI